MAGVPQVAIPIPVEDSEALAKLRRLALEAQRTRAALSGLPEPGGLATGGNLRTAPMPRADIGGGSKADQLRSRLAWQARPGSIAAMLPDKASAPPVPLIGPRTASAEGARRALPPQSGPSSPVIPVGAGGRAHQKAASQMESRMARRLEKTLFEGPQLKAGGFEVGPIGIGAQGLTAASAFGKFLGPAAGFVVLAQAGLKGLDEINKFGFDVIDQATARGVPVGQVLAERLADVPKGTGIALRKGVAAVLGGGADIAAPVREGALLLAQALGITSDAAGLASATRRGARDLVAIVRGDKTAFERERDAQRELDRELTILIESSKRLAERTSREAAMQLRGAGFPGTLSELQDAIYRELMLSDPNMQEAAKSAAKELFSNAQGLQG